MKRMPNFLFTRRPRKQISMEEFIEKRPRLKKSIKDNPEEYQKFLAFCGGVGKELDKEEKK